MTHKTLEIIVEILRVFFTNIVKLSQNGHTSCYKFW